MSARQNELMQWLEKITFLDNIHLTPLTNDASFKRYFRFNNKGKTHIALDAPPEKEPLSTLIQVNHLLENAGVPVPKIHAIDLDRGYALLDDFGDSLLLHALTPDNRMDFYKKAIDALIQIQKAKPYDLSAFNAAHIACECHLFTDWFVKRYLNLILTPSEQALLKSTFGWLTTQLTSQPQIFVHRDYHSRNLMLIEKDNQLLGVIDFQDAMLGPLTYDLASLLKDCYIKLPSACFFDLMRYYYDRQALATHWTFDAFARAVDLCALQRHLKVLGIFCRLSLRDQKTGYLNDLPLVMEYVMDCIPRYTELKSFQDFMTQRVIPAFKER